jgi:hypothetical protein
MRDDTHRELSLTLISDYLLLIKPKPKPRPAAGIETPVWSNGLTVSDLQK